MEVVKEHDGEIVGVGVLVDRSQNKADFGVPYTKVYDANVVAYEKDECPLCKEGKLEAVKPGSRSIK